MASEDNQDEIDFQVALCDILDSELNLCVETLKRKITELVGKKEEMEDLKKRLNEISSKFNDCENKKEVEKTSDGFEKLTAEYFKIKNNIDFDLGGGSQEGDDVKMRTAFNQSGESSSGTQGKGNDVLDMGRDSTDQEMKKEDDVNKRFLDNKAKSDSSDDPQLPVSVDDIKISADVQGLKQYLSDAQGRLDEGKK